MWSMKLEHLRDWMDKCWSSMKSIIAIVEIRIDCVNGLLFSYNEQKKMQEREDDAYAP